jgi:hypothetical protein
MNRKLFIKNIGLSLGTLVAGPVTNVFSENTNVKNSLKLKAFESTGTFVKISGKFFDAETLENISAKILVKKEQTVFTKKDFSENVKYYTILNDLGNAFGEKLSFVISAPGYKTFEGNLFTTKNSINIDTSIWQYNPNFKPEYRPNKHKMENGMLMANFDFHLVRN